VPTEAIGRSDVDTDSEHPAQFALEGAQPHESGPRGEIDEDIDIAVGSILTAGDAAEDPEIRPPEPGGGSHQGLPPLPQPTTEWGVG
jgi:hypothetical protein